MSEKRKEIFTNSEFLLLLCFGLAMIGLFVVAGVGYSSNNGEIGTGFLIPGLLVLIGLGIYAGIKIRSFKKDKEQINQQKEEIVSDKQTILKNILQRYSKIHIQEMAELLDFNDTIQIKRWLLSLPQDFTFYLEDDEVIIDNQKFSEDTSETNQQIEDLLKSFSDFEQKGKG